MWDKIKAFFQNKVTIIVSWVVLFLDLAALIVGGATKETITTGVGLIFGIIGAVAAFIAFICGKSK